MIQTLKNLKISSRAAELLKAIGKADQVCESREYTDASGIVHLTAKGVGRVTCVTVADNMGEAECSALKNLEDRIGCGFENCTVLIHETCDWPHPRMKGSAWFIQFEIFQECL
ncbi:hypothetical protein V7793_05020 [Streptomyces sp. KLMMK]|uniref:hypothetical protein n=1 Tax=Streptomyces sp. KLMMK TaxID=3109353 RepID=UPI002FFF9AC8